MTKLDGRYETLEDMYTLFQYAVEGIAEEVTQKEDSLTVTKEELKEVYLDAAKRVGEAEQTIREMKLNESDAHGVKNVREALRGMRKVYTLLSEGRQKAAAEEGIKVSEKIVDYIKQLRRLHNIAKYGFDINNITGSVEILSDLEKLRLEKNSEDESIGADLK